MLLFNRLLLLLIVDVSLIATVLLLTVKALGICMLLVVLVMTGVLAAGGLCGICGHL